MIKAEQMSESLKLGALLAVSGGFMDAYSYVCRGGVFANAQTGNILLFALNISEGAFLKAVSYIIPVLFFTMGVMLVDAARVKFNKNKAIHWRQAALIIEIVSLFIVGFMPQSANLLANSITSLACGAQVESFRKISGNGVATTMCIGNLRGATHSLVDFITTREREAAEKVMLFMSIIASFAVGAVLGNAFVSVLGEYAVWICDLFLLVCFIMMFSDLESHAEIRTERTCNN